MKTYLDCWIEMATSLFSQALAGAPELVEVLPKPILGTPLVFTARLNGDAAGEFAVILDSGVVDVPFMGESVDQQQGWAELVREVSEAAAGEMLASSGKACRVESFIVGGESSPATRAFALKREGGEWMMLVRDRVRTQAEQTSMKQAPGGARAHPLPEDRETSPKSAAGLSPGLELLFDVELEASLRFGSRELPLGEILDLGPGDVVQLDRQVADPVDLIVADKIVARGEVVLVNGNFGLRVTEVAEPKKRLEGIRCLF